MEDAVSVELEVHLSRLESDGGIRQGLRQPVSALLRQVFGRVRQTQQGAGVGEAGEVTASMQRLSLEKGQLEARVRDMEAELTQSRQMLVGMQQRGSASPAGSNSGGDDAAAIAARCEHLVKEREAVQTIMEQKIKVLVQSIAQSSGGVLQQAQQGNGGSVASSSAAQALTKDVAALQRLVNASIAALRNAASNAPAGR